MPRLTNHEYLRIHVQLAQFWDYDPAIFSYLSPTEQWILHDYFKPVGGLDAQGLLAHRAVVTAARPSLPQQAGRILTKLYARSALLGIERVRAKKAIPVKVRIRKQANRRLSVRLQARPELDARKLARAFIYLATDKAKQDK